MVATLEINALFKGGTKQLKKGSQKTGSQAKKAGSQLKKNTPKNFPVGPAGGTKRGPGGRYQNDELWIPNTERPEWLDGTLPGDRGFDPLGLAKPGDFLQVGLDSLDQNKAINLPGNVTGAFGGGNKQKKEPNTDPLTPYDEVFGLERFRECELIHGRWAMVGTLGAIIGEASTGVSWVDAGKVELDGAQYLGFRLPFTISQLTVIEVILVGGAEIYRNRARGLETRIYPGGAFDPLGLTAADEDRTFKLKTAEIKHARLAMVAALGFAVQAGATGQGALGSLAKFAGTFAPELAAEIPAQS